MQNEWKTNRAEKLAAKEKRNRGPEPELLKIVGDWRGAMGKAVKKMRPKDGWPEPEKKPKKDK